MPRMSQNLEQRTVAELSTAELYEAYEWRLVQEGLEDVKAGRTEEATPEFFDGLRDQIDRLAKKTA